MTVGTLDRRIDIEARSAGTDSLGQPAEAWGLVAAVWANIKYVSGLETIKANSETSVVKASIKIRYRAGLDAGMRVNTPDGVFEIKAVLPVGRKSYINLVCELVK